MYIFNIVWVSVFVVYISRCYGSVCGLFCDFSWSNLLVYLLVMTLFNDATNIYLNPQRGKLSASRINISKSFPRGSYLLIWLLLSVATVYFCTWDKPANKQERAGCFASIVFWMSCSYFAWCRGLVCSLWLWYFLIILTYVLWSVNWMYWKSSTWSSSDVIEMPKCLTSIISVNFGKWTVYKKKNLTSMWEQKE